jgi:hypothetical protein
MGFSQATIIEVGPPRIWGSQVSLSWTSSSAAGTWYQVYLDQALAWFGQRTSVRLPVPSTGPVRVDVGTVDAGEEQTSFVSLLPSAPARRALLTWLGGSFLGIDIAGFRVYGSGGSNGSIDLTSPLADITAYPAGILTDGYGLGGYGLGGFGQAASTYSWTSDPLTAGTWKFAIAPYDEAGNQGTAQTTSVTISAPPLAPAPFADGTRAHYSYNPMAAIATVTWNASPT